MLENGMTYDDIICQSIDTIITERLRSMNFDTTLTCTIEDDSKAEEGIYTVSDGSVKFTAYSRDQAYKIGDQVYVQIPNNDFSEQKIITSLKPSSDTNQPYNYSAPFDSFVKGTENLVIQDKEIYGLTANGENLSQKILLSTNYEKSEIPFTHIGIKANFKTILPDSVVSGNYGLAFSALQFVEQGEAKMDSGALDCSSMYGDPYQYLSYTSQEIVYELSENLESLDDLQLFFFQENNFVGLNEEVEEEDDLFNFLNDSRVDITNDNNLFVTDIEVYLGYNAEQLEYNKFVIYAEDKQYEYNIDTEKTIKMEWFVGYNNLFNSKIMSSDFLPPNREIKNNIVASNKKVSMSCWKIGVDSYGDDIYQGIRWYRQKIGSPSPDDYAGYGWEIIEPDLEGVNHQLALQTILRQTNSTEVFKAIIFNNLQFVNTDLEITEFYIGENQHFEDYNLENQETIENSLGYQIICDDYMESNTIVFENTAYVSIIQSNKQDMLYINIPDIYNGNYYTYGLNGVIVPETLSRETRKFEPYFQGELLQGNRTCIVEWIVPYRNSMVLNNSYELQGKSLNALKDNANIEISHLDSYKNVTTNPYNATYYKIRINNQNKQLSNEENAFVLSFKIDRIFKAQYVNNNIECRVYMDENTYTTTKKLNFGRNTTSGTEAVLFLTCEKYEKDTGITIEETGSMAIVNIGYDKEQTYKIVPHLQLGSTGEEISMNDFELNYEWISSGAEPIDISPPTEEYVNIRLYNFSQNQIERYLVLKASMVYGNGVNLTAILPFHFAGRIIEEDYAKYPEGVFEVIYDSSSGLAFDSYSIPYNLSEINKSEQTWELLILDENDDNENGRRYYPTLGEDNILKPVLYYTSGIKEMAIKATNQAKETLWYAPLIIEKNKWPNSLINSWEGKLEIDEDNNTIKSAMMVAGSKDETDNTFSGIVMGQIQGNTSEEISLHGMYGYNKGEQAFAFKEDGTAFIGKEGQGRINFDGNKAIIKSAGVATSIDDDTGADVDTGTGIILDLDGSTKPGEEILPYIKLLYDKEAPTFDTLITPQGMTLKRGAYTIEQSGNELTVPSKELIKADSEKLLIPRLTIEDGIHFRTNNILVRDTTTYAIPQSELAEYKGLMEFVNAFKFLWDKENQGDNVSDLEMAINALGEYQNSESSLEGDKLNYFICNEENFYFYPFANCTVIIPSDKRQNPNEDQQMQEGLKLLIELSQNLSNEALKIIVNKTPADYETNVGTILCLPSSVFPKEDSSEETPAAINSYSLEPNSVEEVKHQCFLCGQMSNDVEQREYLDFYLYYCRDCYNTFLNSNTGETCHNCDKLGDFYALNDSKEYKIYCLEHVTNAYCCKCQEKMVGDMPLPFDGEAQIGVCNDCWDQIVNQAVQNGDENENDDIINDFSPSIIFPDFSDIIEDIFETITNIIENLMITLEAKSLNQPFVIQQEFLDSDITNKKIDLANAEIPESGKTINFNYSNKNYKAFYLLTQNALNEDLITTTVIETAKADPFLSFIYIQDKEGGN